MSKLLKIFTVLFILNSINTISNKSYGQYNFIIYGSTLRLNFKLSDSDLPSKLPVSFAIRKYTQNNKFHEIEFEKFSITSENKTITYTKYGGISEVYVYQESLITTFSFNHKYCFYQKTFLNSVNLNLCVISKFQYFKAKNETNTTYKSKDLETSLAFGICPNLHYTFKKLIVCYLEIPLYINSLKLHRERVYNPSLPEFLQIQYNFTDDFISSNYVLKLGIGILLEGKNENTFKEYRSVRYL